MYHPFISVILTRYQRPPSTNEDQVQTPGFASLLRNTSLQVGHLVEAYSTASSSCLYVPYVNQSSMVLLKGVVAVYLVA